MMRSSSRSGLVAVLCLAVAMVFAPAGCSDEYVTEGDARVRRDVDGADASMDGDFDSGNPTDDVPGIETRPPRVTQRFACMDCPMTPFPDPTAPSCAATPAALPTLIYPPDGVLLPPNLNVIEIQFMPGMGNTLWEVDFTNGVTDVRATTRCNAITSVRGRMTGACGFTLAQNVWDAIVALNRGGDPVTVTVRGTNDAATCTSTAMVTRNILFAFEDIQGGIYYWQSAVFGGAAGRTGGIYMHDFGTREVRGTPYLESGPTGRCTGCHNLSRDGERISVGTDDPDADDEFADVTSTLMQVSDHARIGTTIPPGFQTFTSNHSHMLTSDWNRTAGLGDAAIHTFRLYDGNTGAFLRNITLPGTMGGTHPDWSADNNHVVFVVPRAGTTAPQGSHHFHGGDLWVFDVDAARNFSAPRLLLRGDLAGEIPNPENGNYYPTYSPDNQFLAFNHTNAGDIFYNREAQVWLATADGRAVQRLIRLNGGTGLTNSWPRWSPFVTRYRGGHILWLTFSSNRNYGVRVENDMMPNCYPTASPRENMPQSTNWAMCQQPQIWMAAVGVDIDEFGGGRDTSWPSFWLPFQDVTSHNHSAQWVARVVNRMCVPLGGVCPGPGGSDCCVGASCNRTTMRCEVACVPENGVCPGPNGETCCNGIPCDDVTHRCVRPPG